MKGGNFKVKYSQKIAQSGGGIMMHILRIIAYSLVITGAVVWGIVGFFNYNIVSAMFGDMTLFSRIVYALVGISGVFLLATTRREECYCDCTDSTHL